MNEFIEPGLRKYMDYDNNEIAMLQFNLRDPEAKMSHYRCMKSLDMALALFEIRELLYKDEKGVNWKNKIVEILEHRGIDLEELIS